MGLHATRARVPMTKWKLAVPKPRGSIPEGMLNKVMVGLSTVLVLALILSAGFCGGGEDTDADAAGGEETSAAEGVRAAPPVDDELQLVIDREERRIADAQQAAAQALMEDERRREQERLAQLEADQAAGLANIPPEMRMALMDSLGRLPDPDLLEIQRQAQLENAARRITSLRANPVALTYRGADGAVEATTEERERDPLAPQADLLRALASSGFQLPQSLGGTPPAGELDIPLPGSSRLPDYENPPRLITPNDPPGWERVYEGQWLEAVLVTQLSGEFPGPALAMVSVPFYSADRQRILIPRGSRLIGSYQQVRRRDQTRLAVGFHRLVLLDGRHVPLRFLGLDQAGTSALTDQVDRHYLSTFLAAGAVGILSGFALARGTPYSVGVDGLIASGGQGLAQTSDDVLDRFLNRLPTVTIRAGHRVRAWFTSDVLIPVPPNR